MGSKSNYLETKLIKHALGLAAYTMPTEVYLALTEDEPTDTDVDMTTLTESAYTGYARVQLTAANIGESGGVITNSVAIEFPDCSALSSLVKGWVIVDSDVGAGNVLYWGLVTPNKTIDTSNTPPTIAAGVLSITET